MVDNENVLQSSAGDTPHSSAQTIAKRVYTMPLRIDPSKDQLNFIRYLQLYDLLYAAV
ncbi:hypothetical protein SARC_16884, partial [Sphaeroforma arctica JP610]